MSNNGGFVACNELPSIGIRVQLAVIAVEGEQPVWLDLRVTWINPEPKGNMPLPGFGGQWLTACSKVSSEHLSVFLTDALGIDAPSVETRAMESGKEIHLFEFKSVEVKAMNAPSEGFTAPMTRDDLPQIASTASDDEVPVADGGVAPQAEPGDAGDDEKADAPEKEGTWSTIVRKLSGLRVRNTKSKPVVRGTYHFSGSGEVVKYKAGKKSYGGRVVKAGTTWLLMETEDEPPELWTRISIILSLGEGRKAGNIDIQATVTRAKERKEVLSREQLLDDVEPSVFHELHCKVNRVDEKGHVGAFKQFVSSFTSSDTASSAPQTEAVPEPDGSDE